MGDSKKIVVRDTGIPGLGRGLQVVARIHKGEDIVSFDGPLYTSRRLPKAVWHRVIQVGPDLWRDIHPGGLAEYLNHSCNPNTGMRGLNQVIARRELNPSEWIGFDYGLADWEDDEQIPLCLNRCPVCRGKHGPPGGARSLQQQHPQVWAQYVKEGIVSPWLLQP